MKCIILSPFPLSTPSSSAEFSQGPLEDSFLMFTWLLETLALFSARLIFNSKSMTSFGLASECLNVSPWLILTVLSQHPRPERIDD